mmetsp:Transcript_37176/g.87170  ORF Transcript_37176/g.87170 Transcript_37176/m.87170 type:complete len:710 (+) Transcript_37176:46-2175(+)
MRSLRRGGGGGVLVACLAALALLAAPAGCFEAARFTDFPVGSDSDYTGQAINTEVVQALLPILTPPDGYVFPCVVGETIEFKVAVKRGDGFSQGSAVLAIVFEEPPELTAMVLVGSVRKPIIEVLDRVANTNSIEVLSSAIYRTIKFRVNAFAPMEQLKICFRGIAKNDDVPLEDGEQACTVDPMGARCPKDPNDPSKLSDEFFPKRCVYVDVKQPPTIVSIAPADAMHDAGSVSALAAEVAFRRSAVHVGELLRVRVLAMDHNARDDVDIEMSFPLLPIGSSLGPRECCSADFSNCRRHPFGGTACSQQCVTRCAGGAVPAGAAGDGTSCVETCQEVCVPDPCRFVRRDLFFMPTPESYTTYPGLIAGIKFRAKDDSGRFASVSPSVGGVCGGCNVGASLMTAMLPVGGTSMKLLPATPGFLFPTMPHNATLVKATVNCPMRALHLRAFAPRSGIEIVPAGCSPGSKTLSEACGTAFCTLCVPELPEGMEVSAPVPTKWSKLSFAADQGLVNDPRDPSSPPREQVPFANQTGAYVGVERVVRWTPLEAQAGMTYTLCFHAIATVPANNASALATAIREAETRCFFVEVERCRYCAKPGDSLQSIAKNFRTDWIQLWGANAASGLGADALEAGRPISLGAVHIVPEPILFKEVAKLFATTEERLRLANPDVPREQMWAGAGQALCVLPGVCDASVALDGTGLPTSPDPY